MPWPVTALLASAGLLLVGIAIPLLRRRVPPNPVYGVRLPATLADEVVWYEVNTRSARDLLLLGALVVVVALALPALPSRWPPERYALTVVGCSWSARWS